MPIVDLNTITYDEEEVVEVKPVEKLQGGSIVDLNQLAFDEDAQTTEEIAPETTPEAIIPETDTTVPVEAQKDAIEPPEQAKKPSIAEKITRPFKSQAFIAAEALNRGVASFSQSLDTLSQYIGEKTGLESGGAFRKAAEVYSQNADYWNKKVKETSPAFVDEMIGEAIGGAVPGIAEFMLNVPYAALLGAAEAKERGDNEFLGALTEGGKRFLLGRIFHAMAPLAITERAVGMGTVFGTQSAIEGGDPRDIAKSFGTGILYGISTRGGRVGLRDIVRQSTDRLPQGAIKDMFTNRAEEGGKIKALNEIIETSTGQSQIGEAIKETIKELKDRGEKELTETKKFTDKQIEDQAKAIEKQEAEALKQKEKVEADKDKIELKEAEKQLEADTKLLKEQPELYFKIKDAEKELKADAELLQKEPEKYFKGKEKEVEKPEVPKEKPIAKPEVKAEIAKAKVEPVGEPVKKSAQDVIGKLYQAEKFDFAGKRIDPIKFASRGMAMEIVDVRDTLGTTNAQNILSNLLKRERAVGTKWKKIADVTPEEVLASKLQMFKVENSANFNQLIGKLDNSQIFEKFISDNIRVKGKAKPVKKPPTPTLSFMGTGEFQKLFKEAITEPTQAIIREIRSEYKDLTTRTYIPEEQYREWAEGKRQSMELITESVFKQYKPKFKQYMRIMKQILGDAWKRLKHIVAETYRKVKQEAIKILKEERGGIKRDIKETIKPTPPSAKLDKATALKLRLASERRAGKVGVKVGRQEVREEAQIKRETIKLASRELADLRKVIIKLQREKKITSSQFQKLKGYFNIHALRKANKDTLLDILTEMEKLPKEAEIVSRNHKDALFDNIVNKELTDIKDKFFVVTRQLLKERGIIGEKDISNWVMELPQFGKEAQPYVERGRDLLEDTHFEANKEYNKFAKDTMDLFRLAIKQSGDKHIVDKFFDSEGKMITAEQASKLPRTAQLLRNHIEKFYDTAKESMTERDIDTVFGKQRINRIRQGYLTHIKRSFWEAKRKEGIKQAWSEISKEPDPNIDAQVWANYEYTLANKIFSRFALPRSEQGVPYTTDIRKFLLPYARIFFYKKHFDPVMPTINAINSIVNMPKSSDFLKEFGRRMAGKINVTDMKTPSVIKKVLGALIDYQYYRFIGFNLDAGAINTFAGQFRRLMYQNIPNLLKGNKRALTRQGQKILDEQQIIADPLDISLSRSGQVANFIINMPFLPMRGMKFVPIIGEHAIQGEHFLGELTEHEFKTGEITPQRRREILNVVRRAQGAYGKAYEPELAGNIYGKTLLMFKKWLLGYIRDGMDRYPHNWRSAKQLLKNLNKPETRKAVLSDKLNRATMVELAGIAGLLAMVLNDDDKDEKEDKGFIMSALKDVFGYLNPQRYVWMMRSLLGPAELVADIIETMAYAVTGAEYKSTSKYGEKGESKAIGKGKQLLPFKKALEPLLTSKAPQLIDAYSKAIGDKEKIAKLQEEIREFNLKRKEQGKEPIDIRQRGINKYKRAQKKESE